MAEQNNAPKLKRALGLFGATAAGVGIILGAGIYVLVGAAAGAAGNAVWISFVIASFVAIFTGLSYAELSSMYPDDAGEYVYAEHAFGRAVAFFVGYIAFMVLVIANAAVALGFSGYVATLFSVEYQTWIAVAAVTFFSWVNFRGIAFSSWLNTVCTVLETVGLVAVIVIALPSVGSVSYLEMPHGWSGIMSTASLVFFAYIGFESIVKLAEETRDPTKNIPRAILLSLLISTVLYVLVAIAAVSVIPWDVLGASQAPLADVAASILGSKAFVVIAVIALFSTGNTVLVCSVAASRVLYGMSREYGVMRLFRGVHTVTKTPHRAVIASYIVTLLFLIPKDISLIAEYTNFGIFVSFLVVNGALIILRFKHPDMPRGFRIPLSIGRVPVLPVLGIAITFVLLFSLQSSVLLGGALYSLLGLVLYLFARRSAIGPVLD